MNAIETGTKLKTALVAIAVAVSVWVAHRALVPPTRYMMLDDLVADGIEHWEGRPLRVHGYVQAGSIRVENGRRSFILMKSGARLPVVYTGPVPDRFRDQSEVVVEGALVDGTLVGSVMLMKCGGKYEGDPARQRERYFQ